MKGPWMVACKFARPIVLVPYLHALARRCLVSKAIFSRKLEKSRYTPSLSYLQASIQRG